MLLVFIMCLILLVEHILIMKMCVSSVQLNICSINRHLLAWGSSWRCVCEAGWKTSSMVSGHGHPWQLSDIQMPKWDTISKKSKLPKEVMYFPGLFTTFTEGSWRWWPGCLWLCPAQGASRAVWQWPSYNCPLFYIVCSPVLSYHAYDSEPLAPLGRWELSPLQIFTP